jgi:xanthine dehydrogenase accessory factor
MATDRPKLLEFGIAEETAWRAGLACGGTIKIYVEPLRHERDSGYLETALATRRMALLSVNIPQGAVGNLPT